MVRCSSLRRLRAAKISVKVPAGIWMLDDPEYEISSSNFLIGHAVIIPARLCVFNTLFYEKFNSVKDNIVSDFPVSRCAINLPNFSPFVKLHLLKKSSLCNKVYQLIFTSPRISKLHEVQPSS